VNDMDRAAKAQRLLEDPTLTAGFEAVRQAIYAKIEDTPIRDTEGLTQLRIMLKLLRDVRANLETAVRDGKLAAVKLEQEKRRFALFR
jgi:hypothetical protein